MTTAATHTRSTVIPGLRYEDAPAAIEWLRQVLGFEIKAIYAGPDGTIGHAELTLGGGMIMLGSQKNDEYGTGFQGSTRVGGFETRSVYVVVPDADAVYARAQAAGASMVKAIQNTEYGSREFGIKDPEGHTWTVGTYDPWVKQS